MPTVPTPSPFDPPAAEQHWVERAESLATAFASRAADLDRTGELPMQNLRELADAGFDTAWLPVEHGGAALSWVTFGRVLTAIARGCPSTALVWLMHAGAATGLVALGTPESSAYFAAELAAGKRFANALSEPTSGNMFLVPLQSAVPADGGHTLDGAKRFISGSEIADYFLVNALVDGVPTFFGVPRDHTVGFVPIWHTMGMRATRSQLVAFSGTLLQDRFRCNPPEPSSANLISVGLPFVSVGIAQAALSALSTHARGRIIPVTGAPLADMQWVKFEVADIAVQLHAATLLAEQVAWLADQRSAAAMTTAVEAKLITNEVAKAVAALGVKVGGASGYLTSSPIQRHFRDAQAGALMAYSAELCRDVVGGWALGATG